MITRFLLSSPSGDMEIDQAALALPYKTGRFQDHPFLKLGDYFKAARQALLEEDSASLLSFLGAHLGRKISLNELRDIAIRSEKHGALYHVGSVEINAGESTIKLALNASSSQKTSPWLEREHSTLTLLHKTFNLPYLPKAFWKTKIEIRRGYDRETFFFSFCEWFHDYHEWHLSYPSEDGQDTISVWDTCRGYRTFSTNEAYEIYRLASRILTVYYQYESFCQIRPWHHAAGDFVVGNQNGAIDVKLVSARSYSPSPVLSTDANVRPMVALIYFLLELSLRMRLDRIDGTGDPAWAGNYCVSATVEGFLEGLMYKEANGLPSGGLTKELIEVLKNLSIQEYLDLFQPIADLIYDENPSDFEVVSSHLNDHAEDFRETIKGVRL
ncbi:MAG: hypothetical protein C4582_01730 [Desulfobacteraceae bacterium]|nr:MAG: hypothetical protein C4582_01730 [Desulfobacteraceae bacterium]